MQTEKRLYTLNGLKNTFKVGRNTLYDWKNRGFLKPFAFCGGSPKYREEDFNNACRESVRAEQQKVNKIVSCIPKKNKPKYSSYIDEIAAKHLKKAQ